MVAEEPFRLREYFGVLRVRKWSIIAITLLAVLGALFYASRQTPTFQSTARVQATNPIALIISANAQVIAPDMPTEQSLVGSQTVTKCAWLIFETRATVSNDQDTLSALCSDDALAAVSTPGLPAAVTSPTATASPSASASASPKAGGSASPSPSASPSAAPRPTTIAGYFHSDLNVSVPTGTTILAIAFNNSNKSIAQIGAQSYAESYIWWKTKTATDQINARRAEPLAEQKSIQDQIAKVNKALLTALANDDTLTANSLQSQITELNNRLQPIDEELSQLSLTKINPPILIADAPLPPSPVSPNKPLIGAIGLLAGLAFGVGLAFIREQLDDRIRGRADFEERLGAPVLVVVPKVPGWKKRKDAKLITVEQPKSAFAESYRTLRTSILFAAAQRGIRNLMVVSPTAGEGKTTTAANLAVVLADAGKRVILVSCDLRKPRIHQFFNLSNDIGLSNVLAGEKKPWEALQDPDRENLRVMPSGPVPAAPAELLQSEQMGELVEELREVSDFVILDTAPVLLVADALALAPLADGVLFVADAENTSRGTVLQARDQLEQLGAQIIGAVFNNFDPSKAKAYSHYYGYYGYRGRYGGYGAYYGRGYYGAENGEAESRRAREALGPGEPPGPR